MRRLSPRLTAAVLWLALALLPLRVLGAAWMQAAPAVQGAFLAEHAGHKDRAVATTAVPACHGHAGQTQSAEPHDSVHPAHEPIAASAHAALQLHDDATAADESVPGTHHTCHLCDLCHSGVGVAPQALPWGLAPSSPTPLPHADAPAGRLAADGLFRPPR